MQRHQCSTFPFPATLLLLATALFAMTPSAQAVVINTDNGGLNVTSILDLPFMGMSFDVTFPDGSFNDAFGSDNPLELEPFFTNDASGADGFARQINSALNALSPVPTSVGTPPANVFWIPILFDATEVTLSQQAVHIFDFEQWVTAGRIGLPGGVIPREFSDTFIRYAVITEHAVPEPTILALIGLGLAGLGFARRRKLHVV